MRIGDQGDKAFLNSVVEEFGPFDVIMDDGSHFTDHQILSFNTLFLDGLKPNGIYFIEDTNTSFWPRYIRGDVDIFDFVLAATVATHSFYDGRDYKDYARPSHKPSYTVPLITKLVEEVRIFDSAVAVYKGGSDYYPPLVWRRL